MSKTIQREMHFAQPPEQVWQAITESATLAEWMFPNDFEPRVGHHFTFSVPGNPKVNFDGLTVHCEVLEYAGPTRYVFFPLIVLTGLWMWKGNTLGQMLSKKSV